MLGKNKLDDNTSRRKVQRSFPVTFTELGTMDSRREFKTITPSLHYSINPSSCGMTVNRNRNRIPKQSTLSAGAVAAAEHCPDSPRRR